MGPLTQAVLAPDGDPAHDLEKPTEIGIVYQQLRRWMEGELRMTFGKQDGDKPTPAPDAAESHGEVAR